ncbi:butyrophilin subfamily 1 member A1-like [Polypterus senegalus]|uniref:butyrophilin subfamily 1 member A1-like n=1 Tax=Polypterus senegalus TaxID=55291 RepID=UPI001962686C|nr:butyrophilin subfamily 1 member A1-like [Polypterus senegalus]XP_039602407.1 butyrophilin subfamily 1 member A1-like [Polypterus senegalus]XP_039602412.1 butyrophilin subfamily 1 member A1-like [Polypterus senegalus]
MMQWLKCEGLVLLTFLYFSPCQLQNLFEVRVPDKPVVGVVKGSVVLPCQVIPVVNTKDLEITWLRGKESIYNVKNEQVTIDDKFKGRVEIFKQEVNKGNMSLKIQDIVVSDWGVYTCNVLTTDYFREGSFTLNVIGVGGEPSLSIESPPGPEIVVKCESQGWFPKPEVMWKNGINKELRTHATSNVMNSSESLFDVNSVISVTKEDRGIICVIEHEQKTLESHIQIGEEFFTLVPAGWKHLGGFLIFLLLLALFSVPLAVYFYKKQKAKIELEKQRLESENDDLRKEIKATGYILKSEWERMRKSFARVTLDPDTAQPHLVVSADGRRAQNQHKDQNVSDTPLRFETWHFVLGRESFTSGQYYWEVDVKEMSEWYLGVVNESAQRKGRVSLKPQSGYWIVRWYGDELTALTDPETPLRLRAIPQKVGMYLDCDEGASHFSVWRTAGTFTPSMEASLGNCTHCLNLDLREKSLRSCSLEMKQTTLSRTRRLFSGYVDPT